MNITIDQQKLNKCIFYCNKDEREACRNNKFTNKNNTCSIVLNNMRNKNEQKSFDINIICNKCNSKEISINVNQFYGISLYCMKCQNIGKL